MLRTSRPLSWRPDAPQLGNISLPRFGAQLIARGSVCASFRQEVRHDYAGPPSGSGFCSFAGKRRFATFLVDPPWRFTNQTGKVAPEHKRLARYATMTLPEIMALPIEQIAAPTAHLYLWCPNALLPDGVAVLDAWGFTYKSNIVWHKVRKDGGSDGRGVGFYFRNVTELVLFGVRGRNARTLAPGRRQVNLLATRKREHSRKPDELFPIVEACSPGPRLELFARGAPRAGWNGWGDEARPIPERSTDEPCAAVTA